MSSVNASASPRDIYNPQSIVSTHPANDEIIQHGLNFAVRYKGPLWCKLTLSNDTFHFIYKTSTQKVKHFPYMENQSKADQKMQDAGYAVMILNFRVETSQ